MKILILGHARHGKDEVASILSKTYGLKFKSSSEFANEDFIYGELKDKYGYKSMKECFEDRINHREEWKKLICVYNQEDKTRLARKIFKVNDIYVGLRDLNEYEAIVKAELADFIIYVDAGERCGGYNDVTMEISQGDNGVDYIIYNNGTLEDLKREVIIMFKTLTFSEDKLKELIGLTGVILKNDLNRNKKK
jgi:dephospho-CoA kinase